MAETSAIWKEGHVGVRWLTAEPDDTETALRVVVMARLVRPGESGPWSVGELVRSEGARPLAIASITGAQRIVEESRRFEVLDVPTVLQDRRLGVVLGRAVAHEIGHYLLQTSTHATHGLMRATIDVREFADLRRGSFRLDDAAQAHLAALAARGSLAVEPTAGAFSY
jgi:hypothetical protein